MYRTSNIKNFLNLAGVKRNGIILESNLLSKGFSKRQRTILMSYFDFIKSTNIFSDITKDFYLQNMNYQTIMSKYNVSKSVISNSISRDTTKFFDIVGIDVFSDVISREITEGIESSYLNVLKRLKYEYSEAYSDLGNQFIIDLNEYFPSNVEVAPEFSVDDLINVLNRIQPLSRNYLQRILSSANPEILGYIKHLIDSENENLSERDLEFKEIVKSRLLLK